MALETRISNETYERLALAEPDRKWELVDGHLREKPGMTFAHNEIAANLGYMLRRQLDREAFRVRVDAGHVRRPQATWFIPDVFVVPTHLITSRLRQADILEAYEEPLPLVAEVWSRSTGDYDVVEKLAIYKQRGDQEIWLVHPYARTVATWVRQVDGSYRESTYREGIIPLSLLPSVKIDLAELFAT